jgi:hypothetical protein
MIAQDPSIIDHIRKHKEDLEKEFLEVEARHHKAAGLKEQERLLLELFLIRSAILHLPQEIQEVP